MLMCTLSKEKEKLCREKIWIMLLKLLMNLLFWKVLWTELARDGALWRNRLQRWMWGGKQDTESSKVVPRIETLKWQP